MVVDQLCELTAVHPTNKGTILEEDEHAAEANYAHGMQLDMLVQ